MAPPKPFKKEAALPLKMQLASVVLLLRARQEMPATVYSV
jgi:hypothetical protein